MQLAWVDLLAILFAASLPAIRRRQCGLQVHPNAYSYF